MKKQNESIKQCTELLRPGMAVVVSAVLTALTAGAAPALVVESADFSGDPENPTVVSPALEVGTNVISGSVSLLTWVTDQDYFRVVLTPNTRLASATVVITDYSSTDPLPTAGSFQLLPETDGNSGVVNVAGNGVLPMSITVGNPNNLVFHAFPPVTIEYGSISSYDYELQLVVVPIELVADTAIHTAVEITFPTEVGKYYQVQCSQDLNSNLWSNLGGPIRGQGGTMSAFGSTRQSEQCFYRVVKL
jgi:hypothetical protein